MRVLDSPSTASGGEARFYAGAFDPLATYRRLRHAGLLGAHTYLHVIADRAEIGWAPIARLRLLDHEPAPDWRARLQAFADDAAALERKAFGYVGFDAVDQPSGILPDGSQRGWPLVEFIIPGEQVIFDGGAVVHRTQTSVDLGRYWRRQSPPGQRAAPRERWRRARDCRASSTSRPCGRRPRRCGPARRARSCSRATRPTT